MRQIVLLVCGGMHPPSYTEQALTIIAEDAALSQLSRVVCAPHAAYSLGVLSPFALRQALEARLVIPSPEVAAPALVIWAFSAGCVGAVALATHWQRYRGSVLALCLVDGWGVPRDPEVPTYRLSHDYTTHSTSRWLGAGDMDFYADPAVPHLDFWQQLPTVGGWAVELGQAQQRSTAADFLCQRSREAITRYHTHSELTPAG